MAVTLVALFGSGDRMISMIRVTGPTSYTQITPGTPPAGPTGGFDIPASAFGLKYINHVESNLEDAGRYNVLAVPNSAGVATKVTLMWVTAANGAEVAGATNLSTFKVRLMAVGR